MVSQKYLAEKTPLHKRESLCVFRLLEEAQPVLEKASTGGKGVALRAMAAEALAMMAFVGVEDPSVLDAVMVHLAGLWKGA